MRPNWIDPGLVRAVKRQLGPVAAEERGALLEGWVHALLRVYRQEHELFDNINYRSPLQARGVKVDVLLHRGNELLDLEVKAASTFSRSQLAGLQAIAGLPDVVRRILVYGGSHRLEVADGVEVWPVHHLLESLADGRLWP